MHIEQHYIYDILYDRICTHCKHMSVNIQLLLSGEAICGNSCLIGEESGKKCRVSVTDDEFGDDSE